MYSVRGAKHVVLQRKKGGLGFSVKGGKEHGIPIVVSFIQTDCVPANELRLGDEILAVNGESLQDFNITDTPCGGPMPQGWTQKIDHKTGRSYYENHYTETATWKDPRILQPVPLDAFNWSELPLGWERFLDNQGDIYFVNHDTHTTHWDSPRGMRLQKQLKELKAFLEHANDKHKKDLEALRQKRASLLEKTQLLEDSHSHTIPLDQSNVEEEHTWDSPTDIADDIMILNEEIETLDARVSSAAKRLGFLDKVVKNRIYEDMGELDEHESSIQLSRALVSAYEECKGLEAKLHSIAAEFEVLRKRYNFTDAPISYMVQLPPLRSLEEVGHNKRWLHLLPDQLTAKTNCEMELEVAILKDCCRHADKLHRHWTVLHNKALSSHGNWEPLLDELAQFDLSPLHDQWMQASFREKLDKFISTED
eukprot:Em0022g573a